MLVCILVDSTSVLEGIRSRSDSITLALMGGVPPAGTTSASKVRPHDFQDS